MPNDWENRIATLENLPIIWYESESGEKYIPTDDDFRNNNPPPKNMKYMHYRNPLELRDSILNLDTKKEAGAFCNTFQSTGSKELVKKIVVSGKDLSDAIIIVATSCERCLNALLDHYGLPDGYPYGSDEWKKSNTKCWICEPDAIDALEQVSAKEFVNILLSEELETQLLERKKKEKSVKAKVGVGGVIASALLGWLLGRKSSKQALSVYGYDRWGQRIDGKYFSKFQPRT